MQALRHIVVGTDFSPCSRAALECALTLANASLARVTLVHVREPEPVSPELDEKLLADCSDRLAAVIAEHGDHSVEIKGLVRTGKPWEKLNNAAAEVGANLIVVGRIGSTRGRDGSQREAIGTVATQLLLRSTSRAVLVVPLGDLLCGKEAV